MLTPGNINAAQRKRLYEKKKSVREATEKENVLFRSCIDKVQDKTIIKELDDMIKILKREGERLTYYRSLTQLDHYKKKVREFMDLVNKNTFKVKATGFVDASGDYSTQLIVEKIDGALDDLTKYVFNKETQSLQILEQLDLIKGMLTDIYQ
jgi:uncharacterized protein